MSSLGKRLIQSAKEACKIARGEVGGRPTVDLKSRPLTSAQLRAAHSPIPVERRRPRTALSVATIRRALEAAGAEFIDENGGAPGIRCVSRHKENSGSEKLAC